MWRQRAPEEHEEINLPFGDAGADLLIVPTARFRTSALTGPILPPPMPRDTPFVPRKNVPTREAPPSCCHGQTRAMHLRDFVISTPLPILNPANTMNPPSPSRPRNASRSLRAKHPLCGLRWSKCGRTDLRGCLLDRHKIHPSQAVLHSHRPQ